MKKKYLTKSRFKTGTECRTKLYYLDKAEYGNTKEDDAFLRALAEGGFQVGELAKLYHEGGIEVFEKDHEQALARTNELLAEKDVTIFEAAVRYKDFFIRIDVLKKTGDIIEVIEVKAKSYDSSDDAASFFNKRKKGNNKALVADWKPYMLDIAFQTLVVRRAFPQFKINSYLLLADKSKSATVDGLNQRFLISRNEQGRTEIVVKPGSDVQSLGEKILCKVNVAEVLQFLFEEEKYLEGSFENYASALADLVTSDRKHPAAISSACKSCEYRIDQSKFPPGAKSGFLECMKEAINMKESEQSRALVFDIWNFKKYKPLLDDGRYYMDQVEQDDIGLKECDKNGLSNSERQWLQVSKVKNKDMQPHIDLEGLRGAFASWKFPLHFIDFETTTVALPFNKGRRPYEQTAFQFSHHLIHEDGKVEHKTQFINSQKGEFPNFYFIRALKSALDKDCGTIFRYSAHENTVLCQIINQLEGSGLPDAAELVAWIKTITYKKTENDKDYLWQGPRCMVDLLELVKSFYYSPLTHGSNSIKKVLPAVLAESKYLAQRYSKPIYGTAGITSLNIKDRTWLQYDKEGKLRDPYKLLPKIFTDAELEAIEPIVNAEEIADGGAAMMAYAKMQFSEMSEAEAKKIQGALLQYCELDTLAMVMIYEHWADLIGYKIGNKPA